MKYLLAACFLFLFHTNVFCQKSNSLGFDFRIENNLNSIRNSVYQSTTAYNKDSKFAIGINYVRTLSKKSAIETGLIWRQFETNFTYLLPAGSSTNLTANIPGRESFLSLPILYKHNFKWICIALGPSVEYFLNWKNEQVYMNYPLATQDNIPKEWLPNKVTIGLIGKISTPIIIQKRLLFEPSIFYNRNINTYQNCWGISLATRFSL